MRAEDEVGGRGGPLGLARDAIASSRSRLAAGTSGLITTPIGFPGCVSNHTGVIIVPIDPYNSSDVCGAIPSVRVIRQDLVGNRVSAIRGIVNGTCNFVLTRMAEDGLDVDRDDAAQKITILAQLAFGRRETRRVPREGIRGVTSRDIARAEAEKSVIRLVAAATEPEDFIELAVAAGRVSWPVRRDPRRRQAAWR